MSTYIRHTYSTWIIIACEGLPHDVLHSSSYGTNRTDQWLMQSVLQQHSKLSPATQLALTSNTVSSYQLLHSQQLKTCKGLHKEDLFYTSRLHHCFLFEQEKCLIRSMGHNADHDPITQCWNQHHVVGNVWKGLPFSCDRCFKCTLYSLSWVFFFTKHKQFWT